MHWITAYIALGYLVRAAMVPLILRRQFTPGASIAWIGIIFLHPLIGLVLYLLVGESRLGPRREKLHRELVERYRPAPAECKLKEMADSPQPGDEWDAVATQALKVGHFPVLGANAVEFLDISATMVDRLVADIDAARTRVHLLYYMFAPDDTGRRVAAALAAAAARGVTCRVLADAFASHPFLKSGGLGHELKSKGVAVAAALPTSWRYRRDMRNHRKLAVIDGGIAFAGSQNLVNADYGGRRGAPWYDLTGRFTGPVVSQFDTVFAGDWAFETGELLDIASVQTPVGGIDADGARMQVVPTGPVSARESYRLVLLGAIQAARHRLVITTPYFVPDDPTLVALGMAADRGVDVTLILPKTPDHSFTAWAGRAHFTKLLSAGVAIRLYRAGLVHSKTATADDSLALFGSANLDVRSFNLNFELSTLVYDRDVTQRLRAVQMRYAADSDELKLETWAKRAAIKRYADSTVTLMSPLL